MVVAAIRKWRSQVVLSAPLLGAPWSIVPVPMKDIIGIGAIGVRLHLHRRGTTAILLRHLVTACADMTESGASAVSTAIVAESTGTKKKN